MLLKGLEALKEILEPQSLQLVLTTTGLVFLFVVLFSRSGRPVLDACDLGSLVRAAIGEPDPRCFAIGINVRLDISYHALMGQSFQFRH